MSTTEHSVDGSTKKKSKLRSKLGAVRSTQSATRSSKELSLFTGIFTDKKFLVFLFIYVYLC